MQNCKKCESPKNYMFFYHISNSIFAKEMYNTSFWSFWQIVLTFSLSFDSKSNHFCDIKQNVSPIFFYPHFTLLPIAARAHC